MKRVFIAYFQASEVNRNTSLYSHICTQQKSRTNGNFLSNCPWSRRTFLSLKDFFCRWIFRRFCSVKVYCFRFFYLFLPRTLLPRLRTFVKWKSNKAHQRSSLIVLSKTWKVCYCYIFHAAKNITCNILLSLMVFLLNNIIHFKL